MDFVATDPAQTKAHEAKGIPPKTDPLHAALVLLHGLVKEQLGPFQFPTVGMMTRLAMLRLQAQGLELVAGTAPPLLVPLTLLLFSVGTTWFGGIGMVPDSVSLAATLLGKQQRGRRRQR